MRVWIDQDLCTGDGLCNDHSTEVFRLQEDGISYVRDVATGEVLTDPGGHTCSVHVPPHLEQTVVDAATVCPGECIFIEVDATYGRGVGTAPRAGATGVTARSGSDPDRAVSGRGR